MEISSIAKTIEDFATNIDKATEAMQTGGLAAAMPFATTIQSTFAQIQKFGKLEGVNLPTDNTEIRSAIDHFLKSAKAAEVAAPQAVALLGADNVNQVKDNLKQVLDQLDEERGGKVKDTELGGGM